MRGTLAMKTEILDFCDRLAGMGFNAVWQGLLITILVAIGLRLLGPTNAATRHATWLFTLLICIGLFPAQLLRHVSTTERPSSITERFAPIEQDTSSALVALLSPQTTDLGGTVSRDPATGEARRSTQAECQLQSDEPPVLEILTPPVQVQTAIRARSSSIQTFRPYRKPNQPIGIVAPELVTQTGLPAMAAHAHSPAAPAQRTFWGTNWRVPLEIPLPRLTGLAVLTGWLFFAMGRLAILAHRLVQIRRLKRSATPASAELTERFDALKGRLGIKRPASLRVSSSNSSPALLGFINPVITIPERDFEGASLPDSEKVLWHELAHLRRYDDWANLVQNIIQAVAFFHPAVPWISRKLSLEREIACDDYVLQGGKPRAYALLLASLADRFQGNRALPAPGVTTTRSQLHQRINMILNTKRNTSPRLAGARLGLISTTACVLAALTVYCGPRVVLAQNSPDAVARSANANNNRTVTLSADTGGGLVAVAEAPPSPIGSASPDAAQAGIAISGPRVKPEISVGVAAPHPVIITAPVPPGADNVAVVALPPPPPRPGYGSAQSVPVGPKLRPAEPGASKALEARLERVERMLEKLMNQRPGWAGPDVSVWGKPGEDMKRRAEEKEMALLDKKKVEVDAKRAEQEAKMDGKMKLKAGSVDAKRQKEACSKALEALQRSREQLERQMEKLDQQIEKLEQEQENLDENSQNSEELEEPKEAQ
jgi:beta-lactamase regulating signal transducer with metallopeptidase domain